LRNTHIKILAIALFICLLGILSIYSSTYQREEQVWPLLYRRQIIWVLIGLVSFILASRLNYRRIWDWTYLLYALNLFLLIFVFVLGAIRYGAQRWLKVAWFNLQPSELSKLILVFFLARYFSRKSAENISLLSAKFGIIRGIVVPFFCIAIPMALIIEQPDLGSALMILFIFIAMLYFTQVKFRYIGIFLLLIAGSAPFFWQALHGYQKDRLLVFLNPNLDPLGAGYTVIQSKIAIGSGSLLGKGWLAGTQSQLRFLPEAHTDFIFASFAEQWGFIGSMTLVSLYFLLIREGVRIASRTQDHFGRLLALGISLMIGIQVFINMAMSLGLAPVVGLPLPLMSYGGSCVVTTFIALGILVNIDNTRAVF
jgi:rod shape determining protein RodA